MKRPLCMTGPLCVKRSLCRKGIPIYERPLHMKRWRPMRFGIDHSHGHKDLLRVSRWTIPNGTRVDGQLGV